ncbi:hypothetical protein [Streptomyces lydicus]|uniref:hypothetical protein n=1 Tax=Streptomyces lydicus TaxID=47763 RepID=UPI001013B9AF|nr:hypothetical protein [Streptomyces lydicus]MCZ1008072.1 hypothetical protein [Streptomyces lydicus]
MASTSSQSGPTGPRPSAEEAARALSDIDRNREQVPGSATNSRWVYVVFGVVFGALFAAPDYFGEEAAAWSSAAYGVLGVGYVVLLNTRKGSAALGQPVRVRRQEISGSFRGYALATLLVVLLAGFALQLLQPHWSLDVPYWRTAVGVVGGGALALFGQSWQRSMLSAGVRGSRRTGTSVLDGTR